MSVAEGDSAIPQEIPDTIIERLPVYQRVLYIKSIKFWV
jgi:hypothetical protein